MRVYVCNVSCFVCGIAVEIIALNMQFNFVVIAINTFTYKYIHNINIYIQHIDLKHLYMHVCILFDSFVTLSFMFKVYKFCGNLHLGNKIPIGGTIIKFLLENIFMTWFGLHSKYLYVTQCEGPTLKRISSTRWC